MMKYSEINSLAALDAARETLSVKIQHKEKEFVNKYEKTKKSYTTASMTSFALRSVSSLIPFDRIALCLVRRAIRALGK
ncbi:MAG: hypothetical protein ACI3ZQ_11725 [Candidatus Cryptobacteroides sp.]